MAHTLLCGQRTYSMPALVLPTAAFVVGTPQNLVYTELKVTNIKPPSGLVVYGALDSTGKPMVFRFRMEQSDVYVVAPPHPVLFLSDNVIQSVAVAPQAGNLGLLSWYVVQDTAYLVSVRNEWS